MKTLLHLSEADKSQLAFWGRDGFERVWHERRAVQFSAAQTRLPSDTLQEQLSYSYEDSY